MSKPVDHFCVFVWHAEQDVMSATHMRTVSINHNDPSVSMSFGLLLLSHFLFCYFTSTFLFPVLSLNPEKSWMQYSRGIQCLPTNSHLTAVSKVQPFLAINTKQDLHNIEFQCAAFGQQSFSVILYKYIFCMWWCLWQQNQHQIVLSLCLLCMFCSIFFLHPFVLLCSSITSYAYA